MKAGHGDCRIIGFHLAQRLLAEGYEVVGFDGMTPYYDAALKQRRHALLRRSNAFHAVEGMLEDKTLLGETTSAFKPDIIIHLAAQAGVRYRIEHPDTYIQPNLVGTANVLEVARANPPRHLLVASTSPVYGVTRTCSSGSQTARFSCLGLCRD